MSNSPNPNCTVFSLSWKDVADSLTLKLRTKLFAEIAQLVSKELLTE